MLARSCESSRVARGGKQKNVELAPSASKKLALVDKGLHTQTKIHLQTHSLTHLFTPKHSQTARHTESVLNTVAHTQTPLGIHFHRMCYDNEDIVKPAMSSRQFDENIVRKVTTLLLLLSPHQLHICLFIWLAERLGHDNNHRQYHRQPSVHPRFLSLHSLGC